MCGDRFISCLLDVHIIPKTTLRQSVLDSHFNFRLEPPRNIYKTRCRISDFGFRGNADPRSSAIKPRIYFWNPNLLLDVALIRSSVVAPPRPSPGDRPRRTIDFIGSKLIEGIGDPPSPRLRRTRRGTGCRPPSPAPPTRASSAPRADCRRLRNAKPIACI